MPFLSVTFIDRLLACLFIWKHTKTRTHTHIRSDVSQKPSTVYRRGRSMQMCRVSCELIFSLFPFTDMQTDWQPTCTICIPSVTYISALPSLHTSFTIWCTESEPLQYPSQRIRKRELIYTYLPITTKWNCSSHRIARNWTVCAFVHIMSFFKFCFEFVVIAK